MKRSDRETDAGRPSSSARTRFALEALFLILVASGAALAQLSPQAIVALMLVAWLLVALIERGSAREQARTLSEQEEEALPSAPSPEPAPEAPALPARERYRWLFWRRPREAVEALTSPTAALEERPSRAHVRRVEPEEVSLEAAVAEEAVPEPVGPAVTKRPLELPGLEEPEPAPVVQPAPPPRPEQPRAPVEAPVRAEQTPPPRAPRPPAREWNLWELERRAREQAGRTDRDEEWAALFIHLRSYASAEGILPKEFDELVRESFPELIQAA